LAGPISCSRRSRSRHRPWRATGFPHAEALLVASELAVCAAAEIENPEVEVTGTLWTPADGGLQRDAITLDLVVVTNPPGVAVQLHLALGAVLSVTVEWTRQRGSRARSRDFVELAIMPK
jgi:hypothetical protein